MFGEKAFELIKELERNPDNVTPFNVSRNLTQTRDIKNNLKTIDFLVFQDELVRQVLDEINAIFDQNHKDA